MKKNQQEVKETLVQGNFTIWKNQGIFIKQHPEINFSEHVRTKIAEIMLEPKKYKKM